MRFKVLVAHVLEPHVPVPAFCILLTVERNRNTQSTTTVHTQVCTPLPAKTRKLCYRNDVRAMHNPTIRTWFEARKSICTI